MRRSIEQLVRKNILNLKAYSSARDEFSSKASVYLDANENPFESEVNRYPDSSHTELKDKLAKRRDVDPRQILLGNGSDEILDLFFRSFCEPGVDNIIITPPTYGMYQVIADINDIEVRQSFLKKDFQLDVDNLLEQVDGKTKIVMLCSPNNPSGNNLNEQDVAHVLDSVDCLVGIDEAYIEFSESRSKVEWLSRYPNLLITQTFSKAWGMAGIRLGMGISSIEIMDILHRVKPPYNINTLTEKQALQGLNDTNTHDQNVKTLLTEREKLAQDLQELESVKHVFPSDANFILIRVSDANDIYQFLMDRGIIIRNRSSQYNCENTLRITVGTSHENQRLIEALKEYEQ